MAQTHGYADAAGAAVALDRYVLSASRTPQDPKLTPSSVSSLSLEEMETAQIGSLATALATQPGVVMYSTGAKGAQTSVFLRGANADQTQFVVDGVRMNDRSAAYLNFLGGADLGGVDRVEVLRGPQSTLYGSSAMGGVILINTTQGCGPLKGTLNVTAGSFDSKGASLSASGSSGGFGYSASASTFSTDNDRPQNAFREANYSTRLEYATKSDVVVGGTFRALTGHYDEVGSRSYLSPGVVDSENMLGTLYGEVRPTESIKSRLTLASHLRQYSWRTSYGDSPQSNVREIADWQNSWTPVKNTELVGGASFEHSDYVINGLTTTDHVSAGYVSGTVRPIDAVVLTAGIRYDDYRSVGSATTGRGGIAWLPLKGTKLHATYGTGFNAPSTADRYGVPGWGQVGNSNLVPEKSEGWDAGIEQELADGKATVSATYFQNTFRNLLEWDAFNNPVVVNGTYYYGRTINRAHAKTDGVELAATGRLNERIQARVSYTYLDAHNSDNGARLTRRPRHTGDAEIRSVITKELTAGVGLHFVGDNANGATAFGGYTTARVFASYAFRPDLLLKARVENALDREYEEAFGYPALPRAVYGSVEWRF